MLARVQARLERMPYCGSFFLHHFTTFSSTYKLFKIILVNLFQCLRSLTTALANGRPPSRAAAITGNESGASAVEFGLIAPVLMTMLLGTVEFANIYMVQSEMTAVAREATRRLAVEAMTTSQTEVFVKERMAKITDATPTVTVTSTKLANERTDITVDVSVEMSEVTFFGFESLIGAGSSPDSTSSGGDPSSSGASAMESQSTRSTDDDHDDHDGTTSSCDECLSASATMIKE